AGARKSSGVRKGAASRKSASGRKSAGSVKLPAAFAKVVAALEELEAGKGRGDIELSEGTLSVTSLGKLYYPGEGFTKGDLLRYYISVAPMLLPAIEDRPLILRRYP